MKEKTQVFKIRVGEEVKIADGHKIVITNYTIGRWSHALHLVEYLNNVKILHTVHVFNKDIIIMNGLIHLTGPDLASILLAGDKESEG